MVFSRSNGAVDPAVSATAAAKPEAVAFSVTSPVDDANAIPLKVAMVPLAGTMAVRSDPRAHDAPVALKVTVVSWLLETATAPPLLFTSVAIRVKWSLALRRATGA